MGLNFYLFTCNKDVINSFPGAWEPVDLSEPGYRLHIAKTSGGWLPLFQADEAAGIKSVNDIKAVYDKGSVRILDEYGNIYDWMKFTDRVLCFNGGTTSARKIREYSEDEINRITMANYFDRNMPFWEPVSHFEYGHGIYADQFFKDADGYEFTYDSFE